MFVLFFFAALLAPMMSYVLVYVARCYAIMLTESSGGIDRVRWPNDRFTEWVGDAWLVLLILISLVGLTTVMTIPFAVSVEEDWQAYVILSLDVLFVWLVFPIAICTAHHPVLIAALPRRIVAMIRVLGMTTPLAAVACFGVALTLRGYLAGPYVVAIFGAPAILVHARAWGRFVWLALNERPRHERRSQKDDYAPEEETGIRAAEPAAAARAVVDDEAAYVLEASDWTPEPGYLAEHYEIQRERERWKRLKAGDDTVETSDRPKSPRPRTALAARKIFGIFLDTNTASATLCVGLGLAVVAAAILIISPAF